MSALQKHITFSLLQTHEVKHGYSATYRVKGIWLAPIVRPRNGKNKVHLDECDRL